jgi:hypothetical protein
MMAWRFSSGMAALLFCALAILPPQRAMAEDGDAPPETAYAAPTYHAHVESVTPLVKGQLAQMSLVLTDEDGDPVTPGKLDVLQGEKIHLLAIDESLLDFQHLLPRPAGTPGHYIFSFVPQSAHNYKIFVDIKPRGKPAQDIPALLPGAEPCAKYCVNIMSADRARLGDYNIYVTLNRSTVHVGEDVIGTIHILGKSGVPVTALEPIMGSYAYITGFYDDFKTVDHLYPVVTPPEKASDRGASPLIFVLHPKRKGYFKYFILYKLAGQETVIPMGIRVVNPGERMPDITSLLGGLPEQQPEQ